MLVDALEVKTQKNDVVKVFRNKTPLMSKIVQFNQAIKNIRLQYIEYKVITYEITSKIKGKGFSRGDIKNDKVTMFINTYTGYSESINEIPKTKTINISKSIMKKSTVNEEAVINEVKKEILKFLEKKTNKLNQINIQDIKLLEIKSIYKPFWIGKYNEKNVIMEA